jgi:hypothetical protein
MVRIMSYSNIFNLEIKSSIHDLFNINMIMPRVTAAVTAAFSLIR